MENAGMLPEDHPRVCGEHTSFTVPSLPMTGSSPRMRGALKTHRRYQAPRGIIPAYAGSTDASGESRQLGEDHPRVCGEHLVDKIRR